MSQPRVDLQPDGSILIWIKVVPGASRDQIAGTLGERLKIRVAAPAEGGKANQAICLLLAQRLGVATRQVSIHAGHACAEKILRIAGVDMQMLRELFARD